MSETESKSLDRTSYENLNGATIGTETTAGDSINSNRNEDNLKKSSDLRNSTSDDDDEDDEQSEASSLHDDVDAVLDGTCSRSRPYVRGHKNLSNNRNILVKAEQPKICCVTLPMPTPPDELDDVATTTIIPLKYAIPSESSESEKCEKINVPESSQTERHNNDNVYKNYDTTKDGPLQAADCEKNDSESTENETSSSEKPTTTTTSTITTSTTISANPAKTLSSPSPRREHKHEGKAIQLPDENNKSFTLDNNNKSDSCLNLNSATATYPTSGCRKSKIPVGIAVAWQRLVTSNSAVGNNSTTSITSSAPSMSTTKDKNTISGHKLSELPCPVSPIKIPLRPSSASPTSSIHNKSTTKNDNKGVKRSSVVTSVDGQINRHVSSSLSGRSSTPDLAATSVTSRPLPSSSVPPNLGLSYLHHGSLMDYHIGLRSVSPFPSLSSHHHHNPHHGHFPSWPQISGSDLSVPQGFNSPGAAAAYLQQTMHNQIQLHQHYQTYNNYPSSSSYLHPGYETLRQQYEYFILNHQQQQSAELLRQYHQQQQQHQQLLLSSSGSGYDGQRVTPTIPPSPRISIPILSPSPTGGVRTPTPTTMLNPSHHSLSLSNLSAAGITAQQNWPTELYHHNSSTTLSPKSLTSSTPSPVTVQHEFSPLNTSGVSITGNSGSFIGRKCATPNPISSKSFPVNSPITTSCKNVRKDVNKIQVEKKHLSMSTDKGTDEKYRGIENSEREQSIKPQDLTQKTKPNGTLEHANSISDDEVSGSREDGLSSLSPIPMSPSSSSQHRHDFSRMESLIEKRGQESLPLFQQEALDISEPNLGNVDKVALKNDLGNMSQDSPVPVKVETDSSDPNQTMDLKQHGICIKEMITTPEIVKPDTKIRPASPFRTLSDKPNKKTGLINSSTEKLGKVKKVKRQNVVLDENSAKSHSSKEQKTPLKEKIPKKKSKKPVDDDDGASCKPVKSRKKKIETNQSEPIKPGPKKHKLKQSKSKKLETHCRDSCDPYFAQTDVQKCEDYKRNVVPDLNLPATSYLSTTTNNLYTNFNKKPIVAETGNFNGGAAVVLLTTANEMKLSGNLSDIKSSSNKRKCTEERLNLKKSFKLEVGNSTSSRDSSNSSCSNHNNVEIKEQKSVVYDGDKTLNNNNNKPNNDNFCNVVCASQSNVTSDDDQQQINTTAPPGSVKIATPNQSIPLYGGNTISLNSVTLPSNNNNRYNSVVSVVSSTNNINPNPVIPVPYHNSPVTLILPRILPPQSTVTNSHHQTSFKLVVSSQEIKIPAFVPSYPNNEGTTTTQTSQTSFQLHHHEQHQSCYSTSSTTLQQNVNLVASTSTVTSSSLSSSSTALSSTLNLPCDSETSSGSNKNTITFIGDANPNGSSCEIYPSSSSYQIRQNFLPHQKQNIIKTSEEPSYIDQIYHQQQQQHFSNEQQQIQNNIFNRKDFIEPDNHLNLLATVAQEFGSRDDLGKLVSSNSSLISSIEGSFQSNSSRGSSLMTSPILSMQSPDVNFSKPSVSISLPTSPVARSSTFPCNFTHDEYEYDEKEHGGNEISPGSYKHPVWLKIPHIIPQAATKVAEKLLKAQRKQEKAMNKVTSKKPKTLKKKRDHRPSELISHPSSSANDNTLPNTKLKPIKNAKGSLKKAAKAALKAQISDASQNKAVSKLRIPKIPKSSIKSSPTEEVKLEVKPVSRSNSPTKSKSKTNDKTTTLTTFLKHSSGYDDTKEQAGMKIALPVPKVAKIRIKLSETETPSLLMSPNSLNNTSIAGKQEGKGEQLFSSSKKRKVKRRHSDGDKVAKKRNRTSNNNDCSENSFSTLSDLKQNKNNFAKKMKLNKTEDQDKKKVRKGSLFTPKTSKTIKRNKVQSLVTPETNTTTNYTAEDLLLSSFTSLTPPPTAKLLFEEASTQGSSHLTSLSPSPNVENENENDFNWVADPTFAVSAIRQSNSTNHKHIGAREHQAENATSGEKKRKESKKDKRKSVKPSKLSLLNLHNQTEQLEINDNHNVKKDLKSQLKSFVHFSPKRVKSHRHHHIKPCLKAEPIVRPLSSITSSSEEEDSDAEIDLEVATLTNSISRPPPSSSTMQQNSHNRRRQYQPEIISQFKPNPIKSARRCASKKRRLSSTHSTKEKIFGRRLSLNLETGKIREESEEEEEELLDIDEDYSSSYRHTLNQSTVQSAENENKQNSNNNKHIVKEMSCGSGSSSSLQVKKLPKKRSSRSSTATSSSDRLGSSTVSNTRSSTGQQKDSLSGLIVGGESSLTDVIVEDETLLPGKIELESVAELLDEMRILTEIQGLFYTGKLNALQPPDVYGVSLMARARGAPPHLIFSAEEVLEKCIKEKKPQTLTVGLRICAYWSPQYSGLYPGRVSTDFNPHFDPEKDLIPIEFDDGDTGMIKLGEIRLLPANHPIREYDPNPLLTLEKKHRKRRHSSTNTNSGPCTGDHEEADCGESYCAKVAKLEDEDDELRDTHHSFKSVYWTWTGLGYKRPKSKKNRNKEFFRGIQRGDEIINVGDSAIFISHGNERPYIGRVEKFWEKKGQKIVNVRWFYHPEEVKSPKRIPHLKHPGALFESPHIDENDVQTIAKKCDVLPFSEFKERIGRMPKLSLKNSNSSKPRDLYYISGYYDPYTYNLQLKI